MRLGAILILFLYLILHVKSIEEENQAEDKTEPMQSVLNVIKKRLEKTNLENSNEEEQEIIQGYFMLLGNIQTWAANSFKEEIEKDAGQYLKDNITIENYSEIINKILSLIESTSIEAKDDGLQDILSKLQEKLLNDLIEEYDLFEKEEAQRRMDLNSLHNNNIVLSDEDGDGVNLENEDIDEFMPSRILTFILHPKEEEW